MTLRFRTFPPAVLLLLSLSSLHAFAQPEQFQKEIERIAGTAKGKAGVAVMDLQSRETFTVNGRERFPMQSVFKFPLALLVLDQVDKGKLALEENIHVTRADLMPDTHSPVRDQYPDGDVDLPLRKLLRYTVSLSDNSACDILFRLVGGPKKVETYMHGLGVKGIAVAADEHQMHQAWEVQYTNWCQPAAMLQLLHLFHQGKVLSPDSGALLLKFMTETPTGPRRIRGMLPENAVVAHKTGTSGTNPKGITAATNDVGIVTLPSGKKVAVVVFVSDSAGGMELREGVIARISKLAWDYFPGRQ